MLQRFGRNVLEVISSTWEKETVWRSIIFYLEYQDGKGTGLRRDMAFTELKEGLKGCQQCRMTPVYKA